MAFDRELRQIRGRDSRDLCRAVAFSDGRYWPLAADHAVRGRMTATDPKESFDLDRRTADDDSFRLLLDHDPRPEYLSMIVEEHAFQPDPNRIIWRVHFRSTPIEVYEYLALSEKRKLYWAESAEERGSVIHYRFLNGIEDSGRILERDPGRLYRVEYFGSDVTFELSSCESNGCDMTVTCENVNKGDRCEIAAGWVSWLLAMKAAVDFGVDLRNHDRNRTWSDGFADN